MNEPADTPDTDRQKAVIDFLSDPANHGGTPVERIDTHLSHIFIAGERVYKLKRALRYGFVDYSTPEKRHAACMAEVDLNRRTAPAIYRDVCRIYRTGTDISWTQGTPVDSVVEMARFDRALEFDQLARRDALTDQHAVDLAEAIADFHCAEPRRPDAAFGGLFGSVIGNIAKSLRQGALAQSHRPAIDAWEIAARRLGMDHRARMKARTRHGFVRHCHGDMHLANICLFNGRPTPFDCIEFDEVLAVIDFLYDLAFPVMDLMAFDKAPAANRLLNRYLSSTRDYSGTALLPLFLSTRAAIRALALALPGQPDAAARRARHYLQLAEHLLNHAPPARVIAIGGFSGTGKSTLARGLAPSIGPAFGAVHLQSDIIRKRMAGISPDQKLSAQAYASEKRGAVYGRMMRDGDYALRAGQTLILDATFGHRQQRGLAAALAARRGVPFRGLWLTAPQDILRARISARSGSVSDANPDVLEDQFTRFQVPDDWVQVDVSGTPDAAMAALKAAAR